MASLIPSNCKTEWLFIIADYTNIIASIDFINN